MQVEQRRRPAEVPVSYPDAVLVESDRPAALAVGHSLSCYGGPENQLLARVFEREESPPQHPRECHVPEGPEDAHIAAQKVEADRKLVGADRFARVEVVSVRQVRTWALFAHVTNAMVYSLGRSDLVVTSGDEVWTRATRLKMTSDAAVVAFVSEGQMDHYHSVRGLLKPCEREASEQYHPARYDGAKASTEWMLRLGSGHHL